MIVYSCPELSTPIACPYLPHQTLVHEYFFAGNMRGQELDVILEQGWRKFGHYFFRPACPACRACTALRVPVDRFLPSRSQKRVLRQCRDVSVSFGPIRYEAELFTLYQAHSRARFDQDCTFEDFAANLHSPSCPSLLARYEYNGRLVGAGYLDVSATALSSVYFIFDPAMARLSLGVFSVLREIDEARRLGLTHYYLGYVVDGCARMRYKQAFHPHQLHSWTDHYWRDAEKCDHTHNSDKIDPNQS